jgi:hypothetical protein
MGQKNGPLQKTAAKRQKQAPAVKRFVNITQDGRLANRKKEAGNGG